MNRRVGKFAFVRKIFFGIFKKIKLFFFKIFHFFVRFDKKNFSDAEILVKNIPLELDFSVLLPESSLNNIYLCENDNREDVEFFNGKVCFEFGHGNGEWLVSFAKKFPKSLIIGCELQNPWFKKSVKKIRAQNVLNAKVCKTDGILFLEYFVKKSSLDAVFINFPDPWHKRKHNKRRVFTEEFWKMVFAKLKSDGKIYFLSDNFEIFEFAKRNAESFAGQVLSNFHGIASSNFSNSPRNDSEKDGIALSATLSRNDIAEIPSWYPDSKYARKWRESGKKDFFYFEAKIKVDF
ncbi:MAG: hypothetical protein Fur0024_1020 [Patescibacteria group bacterium]